MPRILFTLLLIASWLNCPHARSDFSFASFFSSVTTTAKRCSDWLIKIAQPSQSVSLYEEYRKAYSPPPHRTIQLAGTTVYYLSHLSPHPKVAELKSDTQAVVIALGGSGSANSSGALFMRNAANLAKYKIGLVSLDYPFHGNGPQDPKYHDAKVFLGQIYEIIDYFKRSDLPVVLLGHSFGSIVIQELLKQDSRGIVAAFALSPGGYQTPGLLEHYRAYRFSDRWTEFVARYDITMSEVAENWSEGTDGASGVNGQFESCKDLSPIETDVPVFLIAGETDDWNTPALLEEVVNRFPKGQLEIVPDANHHSVLNHKEGRESLLTRRIVSFFETLLQRPLPVQKEIKNPALSLEFYYSKSQIFKEWLDKKNISISEILNDPRLAQEVWEQWHITYETQLVIEHIKALFRGPNREGSINISDGELFNALLTNSRAYDFSFTKIFIDGRFIGKISDKKIKETAQYHLDILTIANKPRTQISQQEFAKLEGFLINGGIRRSTLTHYDRFAPGLVSNIYLYSR